MTIDEMKVEFRRATLPSGYVLLHLDKPYSFIEVDGALIWQTLDDVARKSPLVAAGIDTFSAGEKLAFYVLHHSCVSPVPQPLDEVTRGLK